MNRRSLLIHASRPIVHNGVTLPDLPTGFEPAAVIWNSRTGSYYCIESQTTPYIISYNHSTSISIWIGDYRDKVYYYTLVSPYDTWSDRKSIGYSGYVTGGTNYGIFYTIFSCYDIDHVIYANNKVYDTTLGVTSRWLRDADTLTFEEKNGSFPEREFSWDIIGTTLHIYDDTVMTNFTAATEQPWYSSRNVITGVVIHEGVTRIGNYALTMCPAIVSVDIADTVTRIGEVAFEHDTALTTINIPDVVTVIGKWAFSDCIRLTEISIPEGVTALGDGLFAKANIANYYIYPTTPPTLSTTTFSNVTWNANKIIHVPTASLSAYQTATGWSALSAYMIGDL